MSLTYSLRTPYVRHARCETHFDHDRPPGYNVDFGQSVKDYLDAKTQNLHASASHMPWTEECGPKHYRSTDTLRKYKTLEALKIEHEIEQKTSGIITDLRTRKRPPFDEKVNDDPSLVTKNVHPDNVADRAHRRIEYINQRQFDDMIKHDTMQIVQRISKLELDNVELPREVERQVRHIYNRVISPSEREDKETEEEVYRERSSSPGTNNRPPHTLYMNTIDGRRAQKLFKQVGESLHDSKRLLRKMDGRIECDFYKCSLNEKCWLCRKLVRNNSKLHYYSPIRPHRY